MISRVHRACALLILLLCLTAGSVSAQTPARGNAVNEMPSVTTVPPAAQPSSHFDVDAATEAYLAQIPAGASARSDAYFEGGYWLILWDFIYGAAISLLLLNLRWSARMRDLAERLTRFRPLRTFVYWTQYSVVTFLLGAPLAIYEGYTRERRYGLATQTFGPWAWDQTKGMLLGIVLGGLLVMALFGIVRRLPKTWWIWGSAVTMMFLLVAVLIGPIYLQPLFNKVAPLADPKVTEPILSLARANGIAAKFIYQMDASQQSTRMSANVSGLGQTMRITLTDNLLRRGSPEEIQAVMGHEMGHYVLNHVYKDLLFFFPALIVIGFALLRGSLDWFLKRWGGTWQIRGIGDPAIVPLVILLISIFGFILTPILNTQIRTEEREADM